MPVSDASVVVSELAPGAQMKIDRRLGRRLNVWRGNLAMDMVGGRRPWLSADEKSRADASVARRGYLVIGDTNSLGLANLVAVRQGRK